jgi:phosphatidylglycerol---prolipoprotein diacylglyceryl transferase
MTIDRIGLHFGQFTIYFYALIILLGVLVACFMTARRAKAYGQDPELVWDLATWLLIAGIIGARLWHIALPSASQVAAGITFQFYMTHPLDAINIRNGGLGIPGAVLGGALALYIFTRIKKINFWVWTDMIAPGLILAQAIGRWGNFVNQELYGAPSNLPWAIYIDEAYRLPQFANVSTYHPLFLYECLWNIAVMFLILWVEQQFVKKLKAGDLFLIYLVGYAIGRFLLEFLRLDTAQAFGFDFNQYFMAAVAILAGGWLFVRLTNVDDEETASAVTTDSESQAVVEDGAEAVETVEPVETESGGEEEEGSTPQA